MEGAGITAEVAPVVAVPVAAAPTAVIAIPAASTVYRWVKRTLDVTISLVLLLLTVPLWLLVATLVRTTSPGPVFFRQPRVGRNGRSFSVLKFRSMCRDAEAHLLDRDLYEAYIASGFKLQVADDHRVTRVGRILRKTSLDELPQLLNVLRGDMSLVGPRPVVPAELDSYGDLAHCYLAVLPGITGLWQVSGRSQVRFPERAHLDRDYFHGRSLALDLVILARTPFAVIRGKGAY
jgi:lipopolysaccharide/colanic/teichoic acid biosynthesis glycosyltransferase